MPASGLYFSRLFGQIAVFTRNYAAGGNAYGATASQILLFDQTGKYILEIGKNL